MFVDRSFFSNLGNEINIEYKNIIEIIKNKESQIIQVPKSEIDKMEDLWLFFYIWSNDKSIIENYKLWYFIYWENIIFRWDYDWYNILIWKNIADLNRFKQNIIEITVLLNIFWLFIILAISYLVTNRILRPLIKLSKYISNYDINEDKTSIINKYWNSEIWLITESLNKFIWETREIIESQKSFIQDSSHELKTPLMQIQSNIELMEDKIKDEETKERLESIKISIENINDIVSNLSFLTNQDKKSIKKEQIDILKYLKEFIKNFKYTIKEKNIKIEVKEVEKLIIENNTYYLDRLFWNLISNSIFYNNWNNTIKITIFSDKVTIEDKWIWIEEDNLKRIFNRFYRNNNSNLYNTEWSGLGLTIVKKITDSFGWNIEIESEVGKGTIVSLILK